MRRVKKVGSVWRLTVWSCSLHEKKKKTRTLIAPFCCSSALRDAQCDGQTALMKYSDLDLSNGNVFWEYKNTSGLSFGSVKLVRNAQK